MSTTRLWIDGSSLAFIHGGKEDYKSSIYSHIKTLTEKFQTDEFNIILEDSKNNFRNNVCVSTEYKGQRRTAKNKDLIDGYLPLTSQEFHYP